LGELKPGAWVTQQGICVCVKLIDDAVSLSFGLASMSTKLPAESPGSYNAHRIIQPARTRLLSPIIAAFRPRAHRLKSNCHAKQFDSLPAAGNPLRGV